MIQGKRLLSVRVSKVILILRDIDAMMGQVEQKGVMASRNGGLIGSTGRRVAMRSCFRRMQRSYPRSALQTSFRPISQSFRCDPPSSRAPVKKEKTCLQLKCYRKVLTTVAMMPIDRYGRRDWLVVDHLLRRFDPLFVGTFLCRSGQCTVRECSYRQRECR